MWAFEATARGSRARARCGRAGCGAPSFGEIGEKGAMQSPLIC
ncbi:MAG: hypothetical protein PT957_02435 [Firmicutes bacterium]|nr:hypothetical protein [Bacillota bacterium]